MTRSSRQSCASASLRIELCGSALTQLYALSFPMRSEVDRANQNRLRALPGEETVFKAEDGINDHRPTADKSKNTYLTNFMAPETLVLKVGAQVMLIKNLDTTLVNGTVGTVVGFGVPELQDSDDEEGEEWVLGQKGEQLRSVKPELTAQEARKRQKVAEGVAAGKIEMGPVVDWQTPHGIERKVMVREEFKVEDNQGQKLAWRKQVRCPLPFLPVLQSRTDSRLHTQYPIILCASAG